MSVNILTYMLAASLIQGGMNWKQAVATIFIGNVIVLAPMLLNSHPGAKYGIPFPVLARASFGVLGANFAAVLRALVACGWFGIQAWIGGEAISTLLAVLVPELERLSARHGRLLFYFLADQSRGRAERDRIHPHAAGHQRTDSSGRRPASSRLGLPHRRRLRADALGAVEVHQLSRLPEIPDSCFERHRRILGHGLVEHPRLHALRAQSARTGDRPGTRAADDDDAVFVRRNRRHIGHGRDLRHGDLGSRSTAQPLSFSRSGRDLAARDSAGDAQRQHRRQRRVARQ